MSVNNVEVEGVLSNIVWDALNTREYDHVQIQFDMRNEQHVYATFEDSRLVEDVFEDCQNAIHKCCLLYTSPSPRDAHESRMPSSA